MHLADGISLPVASVVVLVVDTRTADSLVRPLYRTLVVGAVEPEPEELLHRVPEAERAPRSSC